MSNQLSLEELDGLLAGTDAVDNIEEADSRPPRTYTDFSKLKKKSEKSAKKILRKLVNFYLTPEMIENEWTIQKIKSDFENLTNVIFQLKVSDYLIIKSLEEVDAGIINDRMLKAIKDLQNQNMEVMKYHKQYLQIIDSEYETFGENYKTIITRLKTLGVNEIAEKTESDKGDKNATIHRGSKSVIENLNREDSEEADFEEISSEDDDTEFEELDIAIEEENKESEEDSEEKE